MQNLRDLWRELSDRETDMRCVVLTGDGERAFCAGADLKERLGIDSDTWRNHHTLLEQAMFAMLECPVPIISAVNGAAFGGGLELVLASDFAYASTFATFSFPETALGIIPGAMGTQHLPDACGIRRAKELCFTGSVFTAGEALQWGIVNKVFPTSALLGETLSTAKAIARNAPLAIREAKKVINAAGQFDIRDGYTTELEAYNRLVATEDRYEGIRAFNEKRRPKFNGR